MARGNKQRRQRSSEQQQVQRAASSEPRCCSELCRLEAEAEAGSGRARGFCSFERKSSFLFFSQLVEWFAANPQFEQSLVRVLSRAGVLFAFVDAVALELENGCAQYQADAWGGGGLAGVAQ